MSLIVRNVSRGHAPGMTVRFLADDELWAVEHSLDDEDFAALWRWARAGRDAGYGGGAGRLIRELERDLANAKVNRFMPQEIDEAADG